jgi:putative addiction module component (TIGR02574 family)
MSFMSDPVVAIDSLTPEERLDLLERLWESLSRTPDRVTLTEAQRAELDRRLDALEADVAEGNDHGIPWDEVVRRIRHEG